MNKEGKKKKKKIEHTRLHSTTQSHTLHWKKYIYQPNSDQYLIQISNHEVITISIQKKKRESANLRSQLRKASHKPIE